MPRTSSAPAAAPVKSTKRRAATLPVTPPVVEREAPKYLRLAAQLEAQIRAGELSPGERLPGYTEVRERYDTTKATLDRAYAILEQNGVIVRRRGSGVYVADRANVPQIKTIGFVASNAPLEHPYWSQLFAGARKAAGDAGVEMLLSIDPKPKIGWENIDGLVMCEFLESSIASVLEQAPPGMPIVSLLKPVEGVLSVCSDDFEAGRVAAGHLLALGHTRFCTLMTDAAFGNTVGQTRGQGILNALREAQIELSGDLMRPLHLTYEQPSFAEQGYREMRTWLEEGWRELGATALIVHNDDTAFGVLRALREAGIACPGEVSVLGFDSTPLSDFCVPRLSSVEIPTYDIARRGVELLFELAQGGRGAEVPTPVIFPVHVAVRESTAAPHLPSP